MAWTRPGSDSPWVHWFFRAVVPYQSRAWYGINIPGYSVTVTCTIRVRVILGSNPSAPTRSSTCPVRSRRLSFGIPSGPNFVIDQEIVCRFLYKLYILHPLYTPSIFLHQPLLLS